MIKVNNFLKDSEIILANSLHNPYNTNLLGHKQIVQAFNFFNLTKSSIEKLSRSNSKWILNYISNPDEIKVNSNYFRCDEFKKDHEGLHILFSGCSVTYGIGLYAKETWPHKIYNKINKDYPVSGYYNLALPGTGIMDIVTNIFKYINMYKAPDVIFLNLPNLSRFYFLWDSAVKDEEVEWNSKYSKSNSEYYYNALSSLDGSSNKFIESLKINIYQYLLMLNTYCKTNNIKLYIFSYIESTYTFLKNFTDLENVYKVNNQELDELIMQYYKNNPNDNFAVKARDKFEEKDYAHPGTAFHDAWAQIMYNYYMENK